jgi:glycosyltransferase involved in cell wall biosynthesis
MARIVKEWLAPGGPPIRLCRLWVDVFDARRAGFVEVARPVLEQLYDAVDAPSPAPAVGGPPGAARARCGLPATTGTLWQGLARTGPQIGRVARKLARTVGLGGAFPAAEMVPGDLLLSLGGDWGFPRYCAVVGRLKQQFALRFGTVIYDLIPHKFPHFFNAGVSNAFRPWAAETVRLADRIITISQNTRRDLEEYAAQLGVRLPPVDVIRLGDEDPAHATTVRPERLSRQDCERAFVLSVGTLEVRKNHSLLYQLWRRLAEERGSELPNLVLAGQPGWLSQDVYYQIQNDPAVSGKIILLTNVNDAELRWLYDHSLFTLYPSHYEGWGLPVAESLARGKYCIASGTSSLPEVGHDLVDYHDPLDFVTLKFLATRALFEAGFRAAREEQIRRCYQKTSWQTSARQMRIILERCVPLAEAA